METLNPRVQALWIGRAVVVAAVLTAIAVAVDRFDAPADARRVLDAPVILATP